MHDLHTDDVIGDRVGEVGARAVAGHRGDVGQARLGRAAAHQLHHARFQVDGVHLALRSDHARRGQGEVAGAAAVVHHRGAGRRAGQQLARTGGAEPPVGVEQAGHPLLSIALAHCRRS